jgi:hypothetical protein
MTVSHVPQFMCSSTFLIVQCLVFSVLNILDGYTTWLVLKPDHYYRERNPIARWVFRRLKPPAAIILFKALLLSGLGVFIAYWWNEALTINLALLIGNLLFIYVVQHNYRVFKRYRRQEEAAARTMKINWIVQ